MPIGLVNRDSLLGKPLPGALIGLSLLVLGILFSNIPTMIASQKWPITEGNITSRTFLGQKFEEYDGDSYLNIDGYIRYNYSVDGIHYSSTAVNSTRLPFYPYEISRQYPEGKDVIVYYNPSNPSHAVLEPGWVLSGETIGFIPSLMMIAGLYFMIHNTRLLIYR